VGLDPVGLLIDALWLRSSTFEGQLPVVPATNQLQLNRKGNECKFRRQGGGCGECVWVHRCAMRYQGGDECEALA